MHEIASLIREFPFGSFLIITGIGGGIVTIITTFINRNRPVVECNCDCCDEGEEDED